MDVGINLSDIVESTTDAAAVMVKFGGLSEYIHKLCYNHDIHLAVVDVIYKSIKNSNVDQSDSDITESEYNSTSDEFSESDIDDEPNDTVAQRDKGDDIKPALQMVSKIVMFFK